MIHKIILVIVLSLLCCLTVNAESLNFGEAACILEDGRSFTFPMRGIAAFAEGNAPLVYILHGSYDNESKSARYDEGFTYLVQALADAGIHAFAPDLQAAYVWGNGDNDDDVKIRAMLPLISAAFLEKYGDRVDSYGYIGHSRGGPRALELANGAPTLLVTPTYDGAAVSASNIAIITAELDGDTIDWPGYALYEKLIGREAYFVLLENANHNGFVENLTNNDAALHGRDISNQLSGNEQRRFLAEFAIDFFGKRECALFDFTSREPAELFGLPIKPRISASGVSLNIAQLHGNASVDILNASGFFAGDEYPGLNLPIGNEIIPLARVQWRENGAFANISGDAISATALIIDMAIDSPSALNDRADQAFTLKIGDKKIPISSAAALKFVPGELDFTDIFDLRYEFWTNFTPICSISVPLNGESIDNIKLIFDQSDSGSVAIQGVRLITADSP